MMTPEEKMAQYITRFQAMIDKVEQTLGQVPESQREAQQILIDLLKARIKRIN